MPSLHINYNYIRNRVAKSPTGPRYGYPRFRSWGLGIYFSIKIIEILHIFTNITFLAGFPEICVEIKVK
ncbi:MAG: hypothetical protein C4554_08760 [Dethiobacter sp.]|nr:MAG: hypothetical protein C4554_08760 [Dethiobacter sp.]